MTMTNTAARTARTVALGVVSEGTHVTEDLLCAFAYAMRDVTPESDALANEIFDALAADPDNESRLESLLDSAFDAMDSIAPPDSHFGAHEGDGACFGFWANESQGIAIDYWESVLLTAIPCDPLAVELDD